MSYLLVIANTPSENTLALQDAILAGAQKTDFTVKCIKPLLVSPDDVINASGIIIGTTENFGYMSGQLKDFFDRIYYPCLDVTQGMPWACYVSAGQDGTGAIRSVEKIITGLRWKRVQDTIVFKSPIQDTDLQQCIELGEAMALGLQDKIF